MPIYEYRCAACGHQHEALQKLSDKPLTKCPECGKQALAKMLTAAGFQLKGSGWYATDFKGSGAKPAAKTEAKGDTKSDAKAETKGDAKPAAAKGEAKTESKKAPAGPTPQ